MISRRDALRGALAVAATAFSARARAPKRVIVAGAGIGGLSCAWELVRRGHDVVILEASDRTGGHVLTVREGLPDELYVDAGAEHFTRPGYERYWSYVHEFGLPFLYYPRRENLIRWLGGRPYSPEMLADRRVLSELRFNTREIAFLVNHPYPELPSLYFSPYVDDFSDEYRPFDAGLDRLDEITEKELFQREGASPTALMLFGGAHSALQAVWHAAILKSRGVPLFPPQLFRLRGGNQRLTDAFTQRLSTRLRMKCPVTRIEHGETGVRVQCKTEAGVQRFQADFLVCAMSAWMLRQIPVEPAWPAEKAYAIGNVPYYSDTRVIFQSRSRFWIRDNVSPNMEFGDRNLFQMWSTGGDVPTTRGLLVGTAGGPGTTDAALRVFRMRYPGKSEDIEHAEVVTWPTNRWASACERTEYPPGQLRKFWPSLIEPHGRVHFVGAYADNLNWGMEAATRSAYRTAQLIDAA
jgi:monoamine oxidase